MNSQTAYDELIRTLKEIGLFNSISGLLGWDERTQLPPKGAESRAAQMSLMAKTIHEKLTSPRIGELLSACEAASEMNDAIIDFAVNVRETRRSYDRATKLPTELVEALASIEVLAQHAWVDARAKRDFALFAPWLEKILTLVKRKADCLGYEKHPYDALIDEFEPHETTENLTHVFNSLRDPLIQLVAQIKNSHRKAPVEILHRHYPREAQQKLAVLAAKAIGFDFDAGRLDISVHPFSSGIAPGDTRITTRYYEDYFSDAFFGTLHESGHAMYSQGLPAEHFGTPRGDDLSLGIHESQSRLWENFVGRSRPFWQFFLPKARELFSTTLRDVTDDQWYFAINAVHPSFIRTEADECTYNLHVLLRFELEQAMVAGQLPVKDIPAAWNEKMQKYLGITPPNDAQGCLQDIHWSGAGIGYFPTYTLGNLYAAQFFDQAKKDLPDLDRQFSKGQFSDLLSWLRTHIHQHGKTFTPSQLVHRITHQPLSPQPLLNHLRRKTTELYGL